LSEKILYGELRAGQLVVVDVEGEGAEARFTFQGVERPVVADDPEPVEAGTAKE
jgi:ATP-dependent Clp protease ATP-binding subunit ClpC